MKKANWKLEASYPRGYKLYKTTIHIVDLYNKYKIEGTLTIGVRGRNTACVQIRRWCINYSNVHFGFEAMKHFQGHNASHSARSWFNFLLNNMPTHVTEIKKTL